MSQSLYSESPLLPRPDAVAVGTKQPQVRWVSLPFSKPAVPTVYAIVWLLLVGCINMINFEHTNICDSTVNALAAEKFDDGEFSLPESNRLCPGGVFIPERFPAFVRTESTLRFLAALLTLRNGRPASRQVAIPAAKLAIAIVDRILMCSESSAALSADTRNSRLRLSGRPEFALVPYNPSPSLVRAFNRAELLRTSLAAKVTIAVFAFKFHGGSLYPEATLRKQTYFEIACNRIRRAWQDKCSELPFEKPAPLTQKTLI